MDREEARAAIKVMEAYANGKKIQRTDLDGNWFDCENPNFDWANFNYRIKTEPKYRPFNSQEEYWNEMLKHQPFGWIRGNIKYYLISTLNGVGIWLSDKVSYTFRESIDNFTFADGTPFGIKEE